MKRQQKPIFSAVRDLDISGPPKQEATAPPAPELVSGNGISPDKPAGAQTPLVSPTAPSNALTAPPATGGRAAEAEAISPPSTPASPKIRFAGASHDFGEVGVGGSEDWSLSLHNDSDSEGIISEIRGLSVGEFSLVEPPGLPLIIPPRGSWTLTVRYAPTLAGPKSVVYLSITTNDHDFPTQKLLLTGRGVAPRRELDGSLGQTIANSLGMSFRYLPAGTFLMGSPEHEPGRNDDEVPHEVTLTPDFYLQTTPVTQGQWQVLMGRNPAFFISCGDDCPVEQISWHECREFIKRLNALGEGTYRLPTEAEWEYACRAGSPEAFANGEIATLFCDFDPSLDLMGWYCGNSDRHIHPVAQKHPNAWGIYDMHGNVLEWCQDWYGDYPLSTGPDPLGPKSGSGRVIRGGSWFSSAKTCRSASRFSWSPQSGSHFLGFRLVREI